MSDDAERTLTKLIGCRCTDCVQSYQSLGLSYGADAGAVKTAYRDLAKVWHPDRFDDIDIRLKTKAEAKLKDINAAYTQLKEWPAAVSMGRSR